MNPKASQERSRLQDQSVRVSAIVVTRFTGQPLELCLRTLIAEPWIDELVVVDAGNPVGVSSALRGLQADRRDVKLVQDTSLRGMAACCNRGAERATGRWLLFVDPTVVPQRGAVERMVAAGGGVPSPWIIGGRLTDTVGREPPWARRTDLSAWSAAAVALGLDGGGRGLKRPAADAAARGFGDPIPVASVSGAFMLIPRADFAEMGGFDEGYATDGEDLDLCKRVAQAGGAVLLQPAASAVRFDAARTARAGRREAQGLARFAAKHARTPFQRLFALVAPLAIGPLLVVRGARRRITGRARR